MNEASTNGPQADLNNTMAHNPASAAPTSQSEASNTPAASSSRSHGSRDQSHNRGRGGRGSKGNSRAGIGVQTVSGGGRAFGGQLTQSLGSSPASLHADATEFRPGQATHSQM